ncbi:GNAT family N-acetyltransferase [Altererythrobacter salegens]|uniref:GNAT family N-acetyltransferase n=1 Tax=Croceibacterium salegens TaxID=1737568 RepID=A0A6I4T286_9SPHN|nr:GNAT family N-acetyltransferase [Croceibacterium salegens]
MTIRGEQGMDQLRIPRIISGAFADAPHASGREAAIYGKLVAARETEASLVAVASFKRIVGHVLFSEVRIDGEHRRWLGLGPLSVLPKWRRQGIGGALVAHGLEAVRRDWDGCVVLGDPAFYGRFGFEHDPALVYPGPPPEFFQRIVFRGPAPQGTVTYPSAFG